MDNGIGHRLTCSRDDSCHQRVGCRRRRASRQRGISHDNGDRVERLRLRIEDRAGLQVEGRAVDLEVSRIRAGKGRGVGAYAVVGDRDVGNPDATGGVRRFGDRPQGVGERDGRGGLIHRDREYPIERSELRPGGPDTDRVHAAVLDIEAAPCLEYAVDDLKETVVGVARTGHEGIQRRWVCNRYRQLPDESARACVAGNRVLRYEYLDDLDVDRLRL